MLLCKLRALSPKEMKENRNQKKLSAALSEAGLMLHLSARAELASEEVNILLALV